jgi:hypothetical protein
VTTSVPGFAASDWGGTERVVRVFGEERQVAADRLLGVEGDVLDGGNAAADVGQLDQ